MSEKTIDSLSIPPFCFLPLVSIFTEEAFESVSPTLSWDLRPLPPDGLFRLGGIVFTEISPTKNMSAFNKKDGWGLLYPLECC